MDNNLNKAAVSLMTVFTLIVAAIAIRVRAAVNSAAPVGYEDESGFHFGE